MYGSHYMYKKKILLKNLDEQLCLSLKKQCIHDPRMEHDL